MSRLLFTNRNQHGDFVREALGWCDDGEPVFIASAFFTEHDLLKEISIKSRQVKLVVRLGFPTSPVALEQALHDPFVDIRYFTSHSFHPKLYMFGDRTAYVGSANLTRAASLSNQEIMVAIPSEDPRLEELAILFGEYWNQAMVLDKDALDKYRIAYAQHREIEAQINQLEQKVEEQLGKSIFENIDRGKSKKSKDNVFVDSYRRTYQDAVRAFGSIRDGYIAHGKRKVVEESLPLRLEVDSFFSFVRDHIATSETWRETPVGWTDARKVDLNSALERWHETAWPHLESTIVGKNYPKLMRIFATTKSISNATDDELFDALLTLHSFHDRLRFYSGGLAGLRKTFFASNDPVRLRRSLAYLVHGGDELIRRMANMIYDAEYKLPVFGTSNVQELIGWHNKEELPVINGRTTKVLRYFGFDVKQL